MKALIFLYVFIFFLIEFYINNFILTDIVYYGFYQDKFSETRIENLLNYKEKWAWLAISFKIIIKIASIQIPVLIVYLGCYISRIQINYREAFKAVILAEFIFFIPVIIKIIWFSNHPVSMEALRYYNPLSLFSLFDPELLQEWLYYPFKVMNLFEVGYWILLAFLLAKFLNQAFDVMLKIVVVYYGSFLFCWMVFVMFISISNS